MGGGQQPTPNAEINAFVDAVNGFSQAGGSAAYPGVIVGGGERDVHIARMLRLANNSGSVEVAGVGWTGDFQLGDGTWVFKNAIAQDDPRRMITNLPHDVEVPGVPGYLPDFEERYPTWKDVYYMPGAPDDQAAFRRTEIGQMNSLGMSGFENINDQKVAGGTYDRYAEIGQAWSAGRYGDVWSHIAYDASDAAKLELRERLAPPPLSPNAARINNMLRSPIGAMFSAVGRGLGASQQTQDALLATGSFAEQFAGAATGVYKQTLTAAAPIPGTHASKRRLGPGGPNVVPDASNYASLFRRARPDLPKDWQVHHGMPQRYEELMRTAGVNIHEVQFLRGVSQPIHSKVTAEWERFHRGAGGNPTAPQVAEFAKVVDKRYGGHFMWPGF